MVSTRRNFQALFVGSVAACMVNACKQTPSTEETPKAVALDWAVVIHSQPDPAIVRCPVARSMIEETGLPWHVRDKFIGIEFVLVPPGEFTMGTTDGEPDESPPHRVRVTMPYYLSRYELTRSEWRELSGQEESVDNLPARLPQSGVSFHSAMAALDAAAQRFGASFRLPTEAEWEWAARGPTPTQFPWGDTIDSKMANYDSSFEDDSDEVELMSVDRFSEFPSWCGVLGMAGGVLEWCSDWYSPAYYSEQGAVSVDPNGPVTGSNRALRGGAWFFGSDKLKSTRRSYAEPGFTNDGFGLRLCMGPRLLSDAP